MALLPFSLFQTLTIAFIVYTITNYYNSDSSPSTIWDRDYEPPEPTPSHAGGTDVSRVMVRFWEGCQTIFDDENGMAPWFSDADANSRLITTMMEAVPLSYKTTSKYNSINIPRIETLIEERKSELVKAKDAFKDYASVRQELRRILFSNKVLWYWYADNEQDVAFLRRISKFTVANATIGKPWQDAEEFAKTSGVKILRELRRTWEEHGIADDLGKHLATMRKHLKRALGHEEQFIRELQKRSSKGHMWPSRQAKHVLPWLVERATTLYHAHGIIDETVIWMKLIMINPPGIFNGYGTYQMSTIHWAKIIDDLLREWGTLLLSSQQGMLLATRREKLKSIKDLRYFNIEESWDEWKEQNCGGTSCYKATNPIFAVARFLGINGLPLAGRSRDEEAFCKKQTLAVGKTPKVWRSVYEQACCQEGPVNAFIKYAPLETLLYQQE
ncbi:uncharacterized protein F4807DRAFT_123568 [Annulohypoxylon truncatum]|uniref:uncharacterized protein n=1 Tax=Annulohypoxylon truncatum TaxID=327061 RepID=UPI002007E976|nr:uncharacterized protein F4807DRAFT_123568 [Annulohypoxylon truncatum]KAI1214362.1 hypothetical protein F4807DRAFT_123568 [Annulohypoxylon truncatum]